MSSALTVAQALAEILNSAAPLPSESVDIAAAFGRILAIPLTARLTQPPFDASAMDGYAVCAADLATIPATLDVIGESAAGHPFAGRVGRGQAVRIFTGAPLPEGADSIIIQENTGRDGARVRVREGAIDPEHVRRKGFDFSAGQTLLQANRRLGVRELSLAAAMGHGTVDVYRRPKVAILSTGDELVPPGTTPGIGQIVSSNHLGIGALASQTGADVRQLGIAKDTTNSLNAHLNAAHDADVIVTIGGASVGDHDLVGPVLKSRGMQLAFWKIAMRPGKPLMFGSLGNQRVLGLPGNPVSSLICSRIFLIPLLRALQGVPASADRAGKARLTIPIEANGSRTHYMRATSSVDDDGTLRVTPVRSQDSSLLSPLALADCLIVRAIGAPAAAVGEEVSILPLEL